jgi:hypothetical protein
MKITLIIEPPLGERGAYTSSERVCGIANIQLHRDTTVSTIHLTLFGMAVLFTCIAGKLRGRERRLTLSRTARSLRGAQLGQPRKSGLG